MDNNTWTAIGSFATCIYTVAFIISLALIYRQLRSMQISTMATAFSKALDILQNEDRRHDRRIIFSMQGVPLEKWNDEQRMPLVQEYRSKWKSEEIWDGFEWLCDEAEEFQRKLKLKKNFKTLMNTLAH